MMPFKGTPIPKKLFREPKKFSEEEDSEESIFFLCLTRDQVIIKQEERIINKRIPSK